MRILVENGSYNMRNQGDIAMLQVAVGRLHKLWPSALIEVLTKAPDILVNCCPAAHPLSSHGRTKWCKKQNRFDEIRNVFPSTVYKVLLALDKMKCRLVNNVDLNEFLTSLYRADLVIATGGGYITDVFERHAMGVLSVLGMAIQSGKPTAMFGQGIGPLQLPKLLSKAKMILPLVDLIAIREKRAGLPILKSVGVSSDKVVTTGDDSIELAYEARVTELASGIGVNLRIAPYSKVERNHLEMLRSTLKDAAIKHNAPLVPLPTLFRSKRSDVGTIRQLLAGNEGALDGCESLDNPIRVVERVGHCRIIVTGSYHVAVFALAQGIPAIGLANSDYYLDKFLGLADQFGSGCEVIVLDDKHVQGKLVASIDTAYRSAEYVRPQLLKAAERQVVLSRAAYQRFYGLVESKKAKS